MLSKKIKILVFPGGTENGLEIFKSLSKDKNIELISASDSSINHAEYAFKRNFILPNINDISCIDKLNELVETEKVDYIFPANSSVVSFLSESRDDLFCRLILQDKTTVSVSASKSKTYQLLENIIETPKTYKRIADIAGFPVFVKPDEGYGSQGAMLVERIEHLNSDHEGEKYIICEYLPGCEYTIECFSSNEGNLMYCSARTRQRIRMGTSMHSEFAEDHIQGSSREIASKILTKLNIDGLWFFQLKERSDGTLVLLEIETRVAGTMAFSRMRGVNLPLLYIYYLEGKVFEINPESHNVIIDRALDNRFKLDIFYEHAYIDLDDTIVIKGKVNLEMVSFIYQCKNNSVRLTLITKSLESDLEKYLKSYSLCGLFDEVIWLSESDNKEDYITSPNSIFIDDSFSQRMSVSKKCCIPTFDPSMVESLIDKRL